MTITRFLKELKKFRGVFEVDSFGWIRTKRVRKTDGYATNKCLCPIEEMHRARSKKRYRGSLSEAADGLGLTQSVTDRITSAADLRHAKYRKPMLRALGLKERARG